MEDKINPDILRKKAKDFRTVGIILLIFGAAGVFCACILGFTADSTGAIIAMLAAGLLGAVFVFLCVRFGKRAKRYDTYHTVVLREKRVKIDALAAIMHLPPAKVKEEAQMLIDGGLLSRIYINHRTDEVVLRLETEQQSAQVNVKCRGCGANIPVLPGESEVCPYCGRTVSA